MCSGGMQREVRSLSKRMPSVKYEYNKKVLVQARGAQQLTKKKKDL